jgi:uncharacterized protein (TIGR00251 family)
VTLAAGLIRLDAKGATFRVRVVPRAGRELVGPVVDGVLRIKVTSPPVDGEANEALIALLARTLGLPKRAVQVIAGVGSKQKTIRVVGAAPSQLEKLFLSA